MCEMPSMAGRLGAPSARDIRAQRTTASVTLRCNVFIHLLYDHLRRGGLEQEELLGRIAIGCAAEIKIGIERSPTVEGTVSNNRDPLTQRQPDVRRRENATG